ncbi:ECF transporter S component [Anaeromonas frigoriresistens]
MMFNILLVLMTIFVGYYSFKKFKGDSVEIVVSAAVGTLTNTIGVLLMIYLLYGERFVSLIGGDTRFIGKAILAIGVANGIPEVIVAMIIVSGVVMGIKKNG